MATIGFTCEPCRSMTVTLLVADRQVDGWRIYFQIAGQEPII
ncbi:MAG TPA: hypothetical protein VGO04_01310 [Ensifer sp.]|nr:hypothetical protein [Ensifer sp.]